VEDVDAVGHFDGRVGASGWEICQRSRFSCCDLSVWIHVMESCPVCTLTKEWELRGCNNNYRFESLSLLVDKYGVKGVS
jgi:hypothetical protein